MRKKQRFMNQLIGQDHFDPVLKSTTYFAVLSVLSWLCAFVNKTHEKQQSMKWLEWLYSQFIFRFCHCMHISTSRPCSRNIRIFADSSQSFRVQCCQVLDNGETCLLQASAVPQHIVAQVTLPNWLKWTINCCEYYRRRDANVVTNVYISSTILYLHLSCLITRSWAWYIKWCIYHMCCHLYYGITLLFPPRFIPIINVKNLFDLLLSIRVMTDDLH